MSISAIVVEKNEIPSGLYQVVLQEPTFEDRKNIGKRMPGDKVGYTLEEAMTANSILSIDGRPIAKSPKDPIYNLSLFQNVDAQFLVEVFLETYFPNEEDQIRAKNLSAEQRKTLDSTGVFNIPKEYMPSGKFGMSFRRAKLQDKIEAKRLYNIDPSNGYNSEDLMFALQLEHIEGQTLPKERTVDIFNEFSLLDYSFAFLVFMNACFLGREAQEQASVLGKRKREQLTGTVVSAEVATQTKLEDTTNTVSVQPQTSLETVNVTGTPLSQLV